MAESRLLSVSYCSLKRFSFISQRGRTFSCIFVEDSTSRLSNSILLSPEYLFSDIPCTLRHCQCSNISTPTMAESTVFAAWISTFDSRGITALVFAFSVRSADTVPDGEYLTQQNRVSRPSPTICSASFSASIKSASDIWWPDISRGNRILLSKCLSFTCKLIDYCALYFRLLYLTVAQELVMTLRLLLPRSSVSLWHAFLCLHLV